jgi:uncharacterized protein (TIGR00266 family)
MKHVIHGAPSFAHIEITLSAGETLIAESGAMASMDASMDQKAKMNGGFFGALIRKFFGRESFFVSHFSNPTGRDAKIMITQAAPGDIRAIKLTGGGLYMQTGAFVACEPGVKLDVKWAGLSSWIAGEGLLRNYVHGNGAVFMGGYGAIYDKEIDGEYIIDSSHIIGYSRDIKLNIGMSGGIFSSFLSGEGLVARVEGKGKVFLQSRSVRNLANFINPRL